MQVSWSDETHHIFGTDPETFQPTHEKFLALVHPDDRARVEEAFANSLEDQTRYSIEHRVNLPDGTLKIVQEIWQLQLDTNGQPSKATGVCHDITERKVAEEERDRLFNHSVDMLCVAGFDGRLQQVNPAWTVCLGWTAEELTSRPMIDFIHPDDHAATLASRNTIHGGNASVGFENRYRHKDGSYRCFSWSVHPMETTQQVFAVARDVTEQKQAEKEMRMQSQILEQIGQAVIATDPKGVITYANRFAEKLYGWSNKEMMGKNVREVTVPEINQRMADEIMTQLVHGESWLGEFEVHDRQGRLFPAQVLNTPLLDAAGQLVGIIGISSDISERKAAIKALEISEAELQESQRVAGMGSWYLDLKEDQPRWSRELYHMFGLDPAQPPPNYSEQAKIYTPESWELLTSTIKRTVETGEGYELELNTVRNDGSLGWILAIGEPVENDEAGKVRALRGIVMDITARKAAHHALETSEAELKEAQQVARLGSWRMDLETQQPWWSPELYEIFGWDPAQPPPAYPEQAQIYTPASWRDMQAAFDHTIETGERYEVELEAVRPDGSHRWILAIGEPSEVVDGKVMKLRGVALDITERKLAELKVLAQLNELERWRRVTLGREDRILSLKKEVNQLLVQTGQPERYGSTPAVKPGSTANPFSL